MRIALVTDQYLPQLGGVPDSIVTLAKGLRSLGHELRIYAPDLPGAVPEEGVVRLPTKTFAGGLGAVVSPFGVRLLLEVFKPDVIHVHSVGIAAFAGMRAGKKLGIPTIATCHGSMADYLHMVHLNIFPVPQIVKRTEGWYFNQADVVTAPAQSPLDGIIDHGARVKHMQVISNAVDTDIFGPLPDKKALKEKFNIAPRAVLLFGRLAKEKNLPLAIDVFYDVAQKSDAQLVVIGDGPEKKSLVEYVAKKELSEKVRFLGTLRGGELNEAINACDVLLMTGLVEAQGMTTLQASVCGLPAVAARSAGSSECIQDDVTGYLVDPKRPQEFVEKIIPLLTNQELRSAFGEAARIAMEPYAIKHIAAEFVEVYQKAILNH